MTIRQQGGVFGRNPSFNAVDVVDLTATGDISADEFNGRRATMTERVNINRSGANDAVLQMSNATAGFFVTQSGNGSTYILNYGNQKMYFGMNGAEDFHLDTNGNINMVQGGGNLIVANGAGINFSATSGTGTSELLDDYEEGTWTPEFASTGGSVTDLTKIGVYTKVGNMVMLSGAINVNLTSATGDYTITNLPFTIRDEGNHNGDFGGPVSFFQNVVPTGALTVNGTPNDTVLNIYKHDGATSVKLSSADTTSPSFRIRFTLTYQTV